MVGFFLKESSKVLIILYAYRVECAYFLLVLIGTKLQVLNKEAKSVERNNAQTTLFADRMHQNDSIYFKITSFWNSLLC